jgi:hypothetical protein
MQLTELKCRTRYIFHYKNKERNYFRANFIGTISNHITSYLILNKGQEKYGIITNAETWYVDMRLISNIETLIDIVDSNCIVPDDMLNEINEYW